MAVEGITLRIPKGSPLTPEEGDNNFRNLKDAIEGLEARMAVGLNADGSLKNPSIISAPTPISGIDAYVIEPSPAIATAADMLNRLVIFKADVANIGPATLRVNALNAAPIKKNKDHALESSDIKANQYVVLSWDGTNFQMQSFPGVVQPENYVHTDSGGADAYVIAQSGIVAIPAAFYNGFSITFKAATASTGATAMLQAGSLANTAIKKNVSADLELNNIKAGQIVKVVYDGAFYQMESANTTQDPDFASKFVSDLTPVPAYGGRVGPLDHDLEGLPDFMQWVMVCIHEDGNAGYAQNDEVPITAFWGHETAEIFMPFASAETVGLVVGNYSADKVETANKTTGIVEEISLMLAMKWRLKCYARVLT